MERQKRPLNGIELMSEERTLYLKEKRGLMVRRDGPSLWIIEKGRAGRRIPARFINIVYIIGNIKMDAGVVGLFAEQNTPVSFMNSKGETIGILMPYNHNPINYYEDQKRILQNEDNIERFKGWAASIRRESQLFVLKKVAFDKALIFMADGFRENDYEEIVNTYRSSKKEEWEVVYQVNKNILMEMITRHLIDAHLDPHMGVLQRRQNFGLALDICYIIGPEIDLLTLQFFRSIRWHSLLQMTHKRRLLTKDGFKDIIHRFENNKVRFSQRIDHIIDRFFELLREIRI
jgi:hypothetical protein